MAETLIQERYQFDFDPGGAIAELERLAKRLEILRGNLDAAKASGKGFEKQQQELTQSEAKFISILNQEVHTYDGINAKRKILAATLDQMSKGTAAYSARLKEVRALQERELNTTAGLNARRKDLRSELDKLEKGTREYIATLKELNEVEGRASKGAADTAKASGGFASALRGGLASIGIVVGIQEALRFAKESLDAAAEKQQQKSALLNALDNQVAVQERLLAQADKLEANTLVDDDDIIKLDRYLASLGLTEKQIAKLNDASVQLAAVQGTSVRSAADKLIAAMSGQTKGIAKLVPEIKGLTKAQLASGEAADLVAKKFAGSAEALTTGIIGAKNQIKDFSENLKEGLGDAITTGLGGLASSFKTTLGNILGDVNVDAAGFLSGFVKELLLVPAELLAVVNGTVQVIKALWNGTINNFESFSNTLQTKYLDLKEAIFGGLDTEDLLKSSRLAGERVKLALEDPFAGRGLSGLVDIFQEGWRDALKDTDQFSKAFSGKIEETDNTPFLPKTKAEIKVLAGSLQDLENQLSKLRELVSKSVVADDATALTPLLKQIDALEIKIKAAKKLQDELINGPKPIEIDRVQTTDVQGSFLAKETEKARIEAQFIRQNSAERLAAIEQAQARELTATGVTAEQKKAIEERYQRERERLAIETERRIATNALRQKGLELDGLKVNTPEDRVKQKALLADIEELKAKLAELQNKSIEIEVKFSGDAKKKLDVDVKEILDGVVNLANTVGAAISDAFQRQAQKAQDAVDKQKTSLQNALDNSKEFTAEQIEIERKRLEDLQKKREDAAKKERGIAYTLLALNTVVAVAKAASQTGVGAPVAIIAVLAAIAAGVASALALSNGNNFDEGTDYVPLGRNKPGKDTISAKLTAGEAVLDKEDNQNYHPTVKAIRRHQIPADVLNSFVESYRGGSQWMPKAKRSQLPEYAQVAASGGGNTQSNQNYYFQAKLGRLEQESERQTAVLQSIAENTRPRRQRTRLSSPIGRPKRFI